MAMVDKLRLAGHMQLGDMFCAALLTE